MVTVILQTIVLHAKLECYQQTFVPQCSTLFRPLINVQNSTGLAPHWWVTGTVKTDINLPSYSMAAYLIWKSLIRNFAKISFGKPRRLDMLDHPYLRLSLASSKNSTKFLIPEFSLQKQWLLLPERSRSSLWCPFIHASLTAQFICWAHGIIFPLTCQNFLLIIALAPSIQVQFWQEITQFSY